MKADQTATDGLNAPQADSLMEHVDGAINPEKVPAFMKYHAFFSEYEAGYRRVVLPQLSAQDDALLLSAASRSEETHRAAGQRYEAKLVELCTTGSNADYSALVQMRERIARESNEGVGEHYRKALAELSPAGQRTVEQFIASEVTPRIVTSLPKSDDWFKNDQEGAREDFELSCFVAQHGRYPDDVQRQMDAEMERAQQEGRRRLDQLIEEMSADDQGGQ